MDKQGPSKCVPYISYLWKDCLLKSSSQLQKGRLVWDPESRQLSVIQKQRKKKDINREYICLECLEIIEWLIYVITESFKH